MQYPQWSYAQDPRLAPPAQPGPPPPPPRGLCAPPPPPQRPAWAQQGPNPPTPPPPPPPRGPPPPPPPPPPPSLLPPPTYFSPSSITRPTFPQDLPPPRPFLLPSPSPPSSPVKPKQAPPPPLPPPPAAATPAATQQESPLPLPPRLSSAVGPRATAPRTVVFRGPAAKEERRKPYAADLCRECKVRAAMSEGLCKACVKSAASIRCRFCCRDYHAKAVPANERDRVCPRCEKDLGVCGGDEPTNCTWCGCRAAFFGRKCHMCRKLREESGADPHKCTRCTKNAAFDRSLLCWLCDRDDREQKLSSIASSLGISGGRAALAVAPGSTVTSLGSIPILPADPPPQPQKEHQRQQLTSAAPSSAVTAPSTSAHRSAGSAGDSIVESAGTDWKSECEKARAEAAGLREQLATLQKSYDDLQHRLQS